MTLELWHACRHLGGHVVDLTWTGALTIAAALSIGYLWFLQRRLMRVALERAILMVVRELTPKWVPGTAFVEAWGFRVYPILRRLEREGRLERRTEPGGPERGGREKAFYRWSLPG